jgi:antitoxin PrlF
VEPIVSAISKVTTKYQATIPLEVREFLGVRQGDAVQYLIERGEVKLKRVTTPDLAYLAAVEKTLTEWDGAADNDAFRDL